MLSDRPVRLSQFTFRGGARHVSSADADPRAKGIVASVIADAPDRQPSRATP